MQDDFRIPPIGNDAIRATDDLVRSPTEAEISASWQVLAGRMDAQEPQPGATRARLGRTNGFMRGRGESGTHTLRGWVWSFGAVTALIAMLFLFRTGFSHASNATRSYATGAYQQGVVTLNDGTRVTLAPETMLRLVDFGPRHRTVTVDGKAYFEVTNAKDVPFEVRSGLVTTHVLGTAFLVDHAPGSAHVRVAVEEGKVRISRISTASRAETAFTVTAGNVGDVTDSLVTVKTVVDTGLGMEWLPGQLFFHHTPVATVLQTLSRWYGYRFRYADSSLSQRNVTISLSVRSPASALATLEQILRVNLTLHGDTVTLTPQDERRGKVAPKVRSYEVWTPTREVGR